MAGLGGREMAQQASWWLPVDDHVEEFFSPSVITHKMVVSFCSWLSSIMHLVYVLSTLA